MNFLDSLIEAIAPRAAAKRLAARTAIGLMRDYEGAARGRRTDGWRTKPTSANAEARRALPLLRDRARDLVRNNPYASRGVGVIASNMIGYGIKTTIKTSNKKTAPQLQAAFNRWAQSTDCDVEGQHDIYGLQEVCARAIVESGEVLMRRIWRTSGDIPIQLQVLEADYIDTHRDGEQYNGNDIIQGIEYDKHGRRVAYWLFDHHPGDTFWMMRSATVSQRIPADDIIHIYRMDRPGQGRGISWFSPVVLRLRDLDEYEDAQLVRQKIAACFAMFIGDMEGGAEQTGRNKAAEMVERLEPGIIQRLPAGTTATMATPPSVQGYAEYMDVSLHAVAVGLGVPYEALTGDYSKVNFTSGRMGFGQFHGLLDVWQWKMFIPKFCGGVFNWFIDAASLAGYRTDGASALYVPPRRILVDPTREIPAKIKEIRAGLDTLPNAQRETGRDPEEMAKEIAESNDALDKLGIVLDSDPRRVTNGGQAQVDPGDGLFSGDENTESKEAA